MRRQQNPQDPDPPGAVLSIQMQNHKGHETQQGCRDICEISLALARALMLVITI